MANFADVLKAAAAGRENAAMPAAIVFGVVKKEEPLEIEVDGRFLISNKLDEKPIIVPRELKKGFYDTHKHRVFAHDPAEARTGPAVGTDGGAAPPELEDHTHRLADSYWTNNQANSMKDREFYYGLQMGEKVVMLRNAGGQEYLVIGRVE